MGPTRQKDNMFVPSSLQKSFYQIDFGDQILGYN